MASNEKVNQDFKKILSFREGAHYYKMDLHTHSPASECSSFTLPKKIDDILPKKKNYSKSKWYSVSLQFLEDLTAGKDLFGEAYSEINIHTHPRLGGIPKLNPQVLLDIADVWLEDIKKLGALKDIKKDKSLERKLNDHINDAFRDVENYLASLLFPGEYVLRCYIEELRIAALTDHNHPGYIVPRLPKLGTWTNALTQANEFYVDDIYYAQHPGEKIRQVILDRLQLAKKRLEKEFEEFSRKILQEEHKEKGHEKKLKKKTERLKHVENRIEYWQNPKNKPKRLILLPGVEFTASNVHLLAVFPPVWYVPGRIGSILRTIGIPELHWGKGFVAAASSSVQDTITLVDQEGGIVIPAHSNSDFKGLLRLFKKGIALSKVLEHESLLALETIGGSIIAGKGRKRGKDACETLKWLSGGRAVKGKTSLGFVKGSDAHECRIELDGTGEDMGLRFSYVKIDIRPRDTADEVFRSLRLALMSGYSRIIEYPTENTYNYSASKETPCIHKEDRIQILKCKNLRPTILGMTVSGKGAYADNLDIRFNPYLNCIVGSDGKSTLLRTVAYGFGAYKFMKETPDWWLPNLIRVFWHQGERFFCIQRKGKHIDPNETTKIQVNWYELKDGTWKPVQEWNGITIKNLHDLVEVWPPEAIDPKTAEEDWIENLVESIKYKELDGLKAKPLLVNQPRDIFNKKKIFEAVLAKPLLKSRQIIWSTGSPNVPASLDAEKIVVTGEKKGKKQMEIICAGDLHEDEIRDQFVNEFEGGLEGFSRRYALYT